MRIFISQAIAASVIGNGLFELSSNENQSYTDNANVSLKNLAAFL